MADYNKWEAASEVKTIGDSLHGWPDTILVNSNFILVTTNALNT